MITAARPSTRSIDAHRSRRRCVRARVVAGAATIVALACACPIAADAAPWSDLSKVRWSLSALGGATQLDPHLADYRWNADPRMCFGAQATAEAGRWMVGVRGLRTQTTQSSGIPGEGSAPNVRLTSFEAVGGVRVTSFVGIELHAVASAGRAHLGYDPDHMAFTPLSGGSDIVVEFAPIDTWTAAGGVWLRRPVAVGLAVGLQLDRSYFALDTAHRSGDGIEEQRETFGNWGARFEVSWVLGAP